MTLILPSSSGHLWSEPHFTQLSVNALALSHRESDQGASGQAQRTTYEALSAEQ